jgi:hypothetical protein
MLFVLWSEEDHRPKTAGALVDYASEVSGARRRSPPTRLQ